MLLYIKKKEGFNASIYTLNHFNHRYIEVLENRLKRMERILGNLSETTDDETAESFENNNHESMTYSKKKKKERSVVTPNATDTSTEIIGVMSEDKGNQNKTPIEPSSLLVDHHITTTTTAPTPTTTMRTRYIGDMSPLPFLAQKINFEDARIASKIGVKIKRFGQSLVLYEKDETLDGKNPNQALLEELNIIQPGETIKGLNDWIYKVAGVDKTTSDSLMKM